MAEGLRPYWSDILNDQEDVLMMQRPNVVFTSAAEVLYQGMVHPNLITREDQVWQGAIPLPILGSVAGQMLPPANTASQSPAGVRMSLILRKFEEALLPVQNFLLGAP